jgi:hypothetical protein
MVRCEVVRNFLSENPKGRCHLDDLGVDGRIILRWNIKK